MGAAMRRTSIEEEATEVFEARVAKVVCSNRDKGPDSVVVAAVKSRFHDCIFCSSLVIHEEKQTLWGEMRFRLLLILREENVAAANERLKDISSIYFCVQDKSIPKSKVTVGDVYELHKSEDGVLRLEYYEEPRYD
eukprot:TRINITY_DN60802_c0_g1_i1.p1 TRINITY_DN60802_c0_g1~~TRINITY_DN60802_c0_g1_i1.p1  ORF type:complete len:136 (+),score=15.20 TRINITY_DN60802_c0_g1_i1:100-507(+)